jgi:hypothetical protein
MPLEQIVEQDGVVWSGCVSHKTKLFRVHVPVGNCYRMVGELSRGKELFYAFLERPRRLKPRQVLAGRAQYVVQFSCIGKDSSQRRTYVKLPAKAYFRHRLANVVGLLDSPRCRGLPTSKGEARTGCRPAQRTKAAILMQCMRFAR